jgi:molybdopterin-binding protein
MKLSARNILKGNVVGIVKGPVNSEIRIRLPGGDEIVSVITRTSSENLNLKEGMEVYAVFKATNVIVATD